jgi:hypothetical protein
MSGTTTYHYEGFTYICERANVGDYSHTLVDLDGQEHTLAHAFGRYEVPTFEDVKEVIDVWRWHR